MGAIQPNSAFNLRIRVRVRDAHASSAAAAFARDWDNNYVTLYNVRSCNTVHAVRERVALRLGRPVAGIAIKVLSKGTTARLKHDLTFGDYGIDAKTQATLVARCTADAAKVTRCIAKEFSLNTSGMDLLWANHVWNSGTIGDLANRNNGRPPKITLVA